MIIKISKRKSFFLFFGIRNTGFLSNIRKETSMELLSIEEEDINMIIEQQPNSILSQQVITPNTFTKKHKHYSIEGIMNELSGPIAIIKSSSEINYERQKIRRKD